jgi:hypothetical protein
LIKDFRYRYLSALRERTFLFDHDLVTSYEWIDEYVSNRFKFFFLEKNAEAVEELQNLYVEEMEYRRKHFKIFDLKSAERDRENFYHRHGALKKFVSEILFIQFKEIKTQTFYRNLFASFGAACAALFTQLAQRDAMLSRGADDYGTEFGMIVFIGVMLYVFKDRLKEMSKEYVNKKFSTKLPDYESSLHYEYLNKNEKVKVELGVMKEYIRHLRDEEVDNEIQFFRQHLLRLEQAVPIRERVIHYKKRIQILPESFTQLRLKRISLKDIFRLNISEFLSVFDDPTKDMSLFDLGEGASVIKTPKTYYFDMILQMIATNEFGEHETTYQASRLVLDKKGILRQENLLARAGAEGTVRL